MSILDKEKKFEMESLNALFEYATEAIIVSDKKGTIIKANPSSEKLFGYNEGQLLGKTIEDLVPSRYKEKHVGHREGYNKNPHARSMGKNMDLLTNLVMKLSPVYTILHITFQRVLLLYV